MNTPRYPFRLNLGFFLPQTIGYRHDFPFEYEYLRLNETFSLHNFEGNATVTRMQQGLLLQAKFEGETELECSRCLNIYTHRLRWDMTELFAFSSEDAEDEDLLLPDNAQVDLEEYVREDAQIAVPINPICKENCQGLCQVCGADLNLGDCGHEEMPEDDDEDDLMDSPFAGLKDLR